MKKRFLSLLLTLVMLLSFLPALPAWSAEAGVPAVRTELYAPGMKLGYFAYRDANVSADKWKPTVGDVSAELKGDWQKTGKGVAYTLSAVGDTGLYLPFDALPAGDYTVEMALTPHGLTQGGEKVTFTSNYGISYAYGFAFGPFKGYVYPHDYTYDYVNQQYLPDDLRGTKYYEFGDNKTEAAAAAYWEKAKREGGKKK